MKNKTPTKNTEIQQQIKFKYPECGFSGFFFIKRLDKFPNLEATLQIKDYFQVLNKSNIVNTHILIETVYALDIFSKCFVNTDILKYTSIMHCKVCSTLVTFHPFVLISKSDLRNHIKTRKMCANKQTNV